MIIRYVAMCTATLLAAIALQGTSAHALSMKECSAKYKAAKDAGTLNGMKWNDFRKAQCGAEATAAPVPPPHSPRQRQLPSLPQHQSLRLPRRVTPRSRARFPPSIQVSLLAKRVCTPASISTTSTKQIMQTAD